VVKRVVFLLFIIACFLFSCDFLLQDLSATIEVQNDNVNDYTMVITVNGNSKIVVDGETETWIVFWKGTSGNFEAVNITATYQDHGGLYDIAFNVFNGDYKLVIITDCP
jgi:hypothetical protein